MILPHLKSCLPEMILSLFINETYKLFQENCTNLWILYRLKLWTSYFPLSFDTQMKTFSWLKLSGRYIGGWMFSQYWSSPWKRKTYTKSGFQGLYPNLLMETNDLPLQTLQKLWFWTWFYLILLHLLFYSFS